MGKHSAAEKLRALNAHRDLIRAAERGLIQKVRCAMPVCFYPNPKPARGYYPDPNPDFGGRWLFEKNPKGTNPPPSGPNRDHYPDLQSQDGGHSLENIRLSHVLCNALDWQRNPIHAQARDELNARNAAAGAQWAKNHPDEAVKNAATSAAAHRAEANESRSPSASRARLGSQDD